MPDIVVHAAMGERVYAAQGQGLDRDIFAFGLLGPDPYLFYRFYVPPFRHRANRYSSVMHRQRTGDFLLALARRARGDGDVLAWLAGFVCHYALDAGTHPFIIDRANGDHARHMAIEHRLDREFGGQVRIPPFLPERMRSAVGGAIREIYGWDDAWEKLKQGHADMTPFYKLALDEHGALNTLFGWMGGAPAMLSYKSTACDDVDLTGFMPLYEQAVVQGIEYVKAARAYAVGEMDEAALKAIIGSRSYIEG